MTVDTVATIERFVRKMIVWAPSEWPTLTHYLNVINVLEMNHYDFLTWKSFAESVLPSSVNKAIDET